MTPYRGGRVTHYAIGATPDSPCGYMSLWHRGLNYTRNIGQVTCSRCVRWIAREGADRPGAKVVSVMVLR